MAEKVDCLLFTSPERCENSGTSLQLTNDTFVVLTVFVIKSELETVPPP